MKLWFDTETRELVTEREMIRLYAIKIISMCAEQGVASTENMIFSDEYTYEDFLRDCSTPWNGTLVEVRNPEILGKLMIKEM